MSPLKIKLAKEDTDQTDSKIVSKAVLYSGDDVLILEGIVGLGWDLPGGHIHVGESPLDGLKREVYEETGLRIENAVETHMKGHTHYFKAEIRRNAEITLSWEHTGYKFIHHSEAENLNMSKKFKNAIKKAMETT
jgi:8-oxo-dGTP pyrophosphatase MutT (NUDIX family)